MPAPLGLRGVAVGEGDTGDEALADLASAVRCHLDAFGRGAMDLGSPVLDAFLTDARSAVG